MSFELIDGGVGRFCFQTVSRRSKSSFGGRSAGFMEKGNGPRSAGAWQRANFGLTAGCTQRLPLRREIDTFARTVRDAAAQTIDGDED